MRSIFFKIFLWFWLAYVLVAHVLFISGMWTEPRVRHEQFSHFLDDVHEMYGRRALEVYEGEGKTGLKKFLAHLQETTGSEMVLWREGNRDLLDRPLPDEVERRFRDIQPKREPPGPGPHAWMVKEVSGTASGRYWMAFKMPDPFQETFTQPGALLLRLAVTVLMAGLVCYGLARYLTAPLRKLQLATRRLASGDLSARLGATFGKRGDEIGALGRDFDFMAERIDSLMATQNRLLRDISHELRSPLTRLNVALELTRTRTGDEAKDFLDRIEREVNRLNALIGQLLTLARLDSGPNLGNACEFDLSELVAQVIQDADFEAQSRQRQVKFIKCQEIFITGFPELLRSAIENVVRNATHYTRKGTAVEVTLKTRDEPEGRFAELWVRDFGPGVPEEELTKLFQPFYRVADARDRGSRGAGLGLSITDRAVKIHHGTLIAANHPEGGLWVQICLPESPRRSPNPSG